jgi:DNA-binding transcriptional regulator YiaG
VKKTPSLLWQKFDMTAEELKLAQRVLGLSDAKFAAWLGVSDGSTVRKWKRGDRDIPGPVVVLVKAAISSEAVRSHFGLSLPDDSTSNSE